MSRWIALAALDGCGDRAVPDWEKDEGRGIFHVQRLLSGPERKKFGIVEPRDIRGSAEEQTIIECVFAEAPYLRGFL